jgi:hypothetical protein
VRDELASLGDRVTYVSVDIEAIEDAAAVKRYANEHRFGWRFAVAPKQMIEDFASAFGAQFLLTTSVPIFVVDPDRHVHLTESGHKSAEALHRLVDTYRSIDTVLTGEPSAHVYLAATANLELIDRQRLRVGITYR